VKDPKKSVYRKAAEELLIEEFLEKKSILTIELAAVYLNISESKLRQMAQAREVPCKKLGEKYIFSKRLLDKWVEKMCLNSIVGDFDTEEEE